MTTMACKVLAPAPTVVFALLLLLSLFLQAAIAASWDGTPRLRYGFYDDTCPDAEEIVRDVVAFSYFWNPSIAAGIMRIHFHDCFTQGCDGSILLDRTPSGGPVEKEGIPNGSTLVGLDVIDAVKSALEDACPGTVSCADALAFAAREAAVLSGLERYQIPSGRRDGTSSHAEDTKNLPAPLPSVQYLAEEFAAKGFSLTEMVVLSGAHSIGGAHCGSFGDRLYNATGGAPLDASLAEYLMSQCPVEGAVVTSALGEEPKVPFQLAAAQKLDASYYVELLSGKGLLASDQVLAMGGRTRRLVKQYARNPGTWERKFRKAMVKLGAMGVLTGEEGEVRWDCRSVNGY